MGEGGLIFTLRRTSQNIITFNIDLLAVVNITISPEFVEVSESEVDQPIVFVVRKEGLSERAVEVIAFTRNISVYG